VPVLVLLPLLSSSSPCSGLGGVIDDSGPPVGGVGSLVKSVKGLILITIGEGRSGKAIVVLYYDSPALGVPGGVTAASLRVTVVVSLLRGRYYSYLIHKFIFY
jgi:hypothetical protein